MQFSHGILSFLKHTNYNEIRVFIKQLIDRAKAKDPHEINKISLKGDLSVQNL